MKHTKRYMAVLATCTLIASAFTSCGDSKSESPANFGNYHQTAPSSGTESSAEGEYYDTAPAECYESPQSEEYGTWKDEPELPSYNEEYNGYTETGFKDPSVEPLSTFSADVDTASYSNVRRLIEDNNIVPQDAVRIEEFINYFDYNYPQPEDGSAFGRYVEIADCPWNNAHKLMMVGIQGKEMEVKEAHPSNLVFLIDSSGSMSSYDKLPLVQTAFSMLAENLTKNDRISIVTYAGSSKTVIAGADGSKKDDILEALYSITASGGTNGEGGIETAYELAEKYFINGGNNRIILATDGDLNIGASSQEELTELIEKKRDKGIYLSVLGFGTGNYKDARLEAVADNGNGNYSYIDSIDEAQRVLVQEMSGTLYTIAKDVKIQVEFNPSQVRSYRLIGYDNRLMNAEDFYDDTKDAGEVGAGHSVTALYEVELADENGSYHGIPLEFASEHQNAEPMANTDTAKRSELCKISLAYKTPDSESNVNTSDLYGMESYRSEPTGSMKLAQAVAEFGMLLRNSEYKGSSDYRTILKTIDEIDSGSNEKISELRDLVETVSEY